MRPFTDHEWETLPVIFMADDSKPWDPSVLNNNLSDDQDWWEAKPQPDNPYQDFTKTGDFKHCSVYMSEWSWDPWGDPALEPPDPKEQITFTAESIHGPLL